MDPEQSSVSGEALRQPSLPKLLTPWLCAGLAIEYLCRGLQLGILLQLDGQQSTLSSGWPFTMLILCLGLLLQNICLVHVLCGLPFLFRRPENFQIFYNIISLLKTTGASAVSNSHLLFINESEQNRKIVQGDVEICLFLVAIGSVILAVENRFIRLNFPFTSRSNKLTLTNRCLSVFNHIGDILSVVTAFLAATGARIDYGMAAQFLTIGTMLGASAAVVATVGSGLYVHILCERKQKQHHHKAYQV